MCLVRPEGSFGPSLVTPALINVNTASLEAQGMTPPPRHPPVFSPSLPIPAILSSPSHFIHPTELFMSELHVENNIQLALIMKN